MKINIKSWRVNMLQCMAGVSFSLLLMIALAMLLPTAHGTVSASCATGEETEGCATSRVTTEFALELKTAISVALENQVSLEIVPRSNGATGYGSAKLSVSTNSNAGYGIFLSTDTANGDLLSTSSSGEAAISNTSLNDVLLSNLEQNTYGYALESTQANDTTKYSHIPTDSTSIKTTSSTTSTGSDYVYGDTYYLSFGAKVGTDLPAGKYAGTIVVSAVANPRTIANLADLTYMQDMTSDVCRNTREHYTKQLIDARDGKSYWVAKLKDGRCWMTQNLALTITQEMIDNGSINSGNTDIAFTWGNEPAWTDGKSWDALGIDYLLQNYPGKYVKPSVTWEGSSNFDYTGYDATASLGFAEKILTNPIAPETCDITNNDITTCKWIMDVQGWTPNYAATEANTVDAVNKTYDAHYLVGSYYQYNTATAGTGAELTNDAAVGSICPKGWMIPVDLDEFSGLFYSYGMMKDKHSMNGTISGAIDGKTYNIATNPLYFTRLGDFYTNKLSGIGGYGTYWSSVADGNDESAAYVMDFNEERVAVSVSSDKDSFFLVRCVAR